MNKAGKTFSIFLVVISILLLSLTVITIFFFKKENELRKSLEQQLALSKESEARLDNELKETKKQVFLFEEKNKEADEKINGLMDEVELQEGIRDQMKAENSSLKDALAKESQEKEAIEKELTMALAKAASLEEKFNSQEGSLVESEGITPESVSETGPVDLEKIVVRPSEVPEGRVISVNAENNFLIFNLGDEDGVIPDMVLSVYRAKQYLGDIKVARVQEGMSVADFIPPFPKDQFKKDDRVLVKK